MFNNLSSVKNWYFLIPLGGMVIWNGMLIAMLICWAGQGHPMYAFIGRYQDPVYISHIGATNLQPLFISCSGAQGIFYCITLVFEYRLRKSGKLQYWFKKDERNLIFAACVLAIIGQLGILFCSIFNTNDFHTVHASMLVIFIVFLFLSLVCLMTEHLLMARHYKQIHVHHKTWNKFLIYTVLTVIWTIAAIVMAICFAAVDDYSVSGRFEWSLAFWYTFIWIIFAWDFYPAAKKTRKNLPYIHDWTNKGFYLYEEHYGADANAEKPPAVLSDNDQNIETLVNSNDESSQHERTFTDEELAQYPQRHNGQDTYPIPDGQTVRMYPRIDA